MARVRRSSPGLTTMVFGCFLLGSVLLAGGLAVFVPEYSRAIADRSLDRDLQTRTQSAALDFARALHSDWREVQYLATMIGTMSPSDARAALDGLSGSGDRISWAGVADLGGQVSVASNGMLEGADVSARPWFEAGLRGQYAGDVHDALLLNSLLGNDSDDPLRFIDFALPVNDTSENVTGVLASHINFDWVRQFLSETAAVREIDLFLVNSSGTVVFATADIPSDAQSLQSVRAATAGIRAQIREVWPDGREYSSSIVPQIAYSDLPSFGWRLAGRVSGDTYDGSRREIAGMLAMIIVGAVASFAVSAALFAMAFIRPLNRLVDCAEHIAKGVDDYPPESYSSSEALRLSWALSRIQSRLNPKSPPDLGASTTDQK